MPRRPKPYWKGACLLQKHRPPHSTTPSVFPKSYPKIDLLALGLSFSCGKVDGVMASMAGPVRLSAIPAYWQRNNGLEIIAVECSKRSLVEASNARPACRIRWSGRLGGE